jgi:hypothetical protein
MALIRFVGRTGPVFIDPTKVASIHPAADAGYSWVTLDVPMLNKPYLVQGTPDEVFAALGEGLGSSVQVTRDVSGKQSGDK